MINIGNTTSKINLCHTCNIYRPPRTHHCSECGVCIERMDHHCPWLGICIGKLNYKYYFFYLLSLFIAVVNIIVMSITIMAKGEAYVLPSILIFVCLPVLIYDGGNLGFHIYLSFVNLTTREYLNGMWVEAAGNPKNKGNCLKNVIKTFFNKSER